MARLKPLQVRRKRVRVIARIEVGRKKKNKDSCFFIEGMKAMKNLKFCGLF